MRQLLVPLQAEAGIFSGTCLASDSGMPVLKKSALETYLKVRFGPSAELLAIRLWRACPVDFPPGRQDPPGGVGHDESRSIRP